MHWGATTRCMVPTKMKLVVSCDEHEKIARTFRMFDLFYLCLFSGSMYVIDNNPGVRKTSCIHLDCWHMHHIMAIEE